MVLTLRLALLFLLNALLSQGLSASSLEQVQRRGSLVIISFPHQESLFVRPDLEALRESGQPLSKLRSGQAYGGIDVEILSAFAESLGVGLEVHPVTTSYSDLIPALLDGHGDLIASSLSITEARSLRVDFSTPYLSSWVVVAAPPGGKIRSLDDLAGLRAAVMRGSSQLEYLRALKIPKLDLLLTDYSLENYLALEEKTADFSLFDSWREPGEPLKRSMPDAVVAFRLRPFDYGYALPLGSDLAASLNRFLTEMKDSGAIDDIVARHSK